MSNLAEQRTLPQAATRRSRRISIIWIVPLVAVAIGGLARLGHAVEGRADDQDLVRERRRAAGRPVAAQIQGHRVRHGKEPGALARPDACRRHGRHDPPGRAAADRGNRVLGRQAAALRRQYFRHRDPALGLLYRHVAGGQGRQEPAGFRRTRGSPGPGSACPGSHLSVEIQADRRGLGRLADLFPRPQRRRGARLGHRRYGGIRDDPRLCPGAL